VAVCGVPKRRHGENSEEVEDIPEKESEPRKVEPGLDRSQSGGGVSEAGV